MWASRYWCMHARIRRRPLGCRGSLPSPRPTPSSPNPLVPTPRPITSNPGAHLPAAPLTQSEMLSEQPLNPLPVAELLRQSNTSRGSTILAQSPV